MTQLLAVLANIEAGFAEAWPHAVIEDGLAAIFTTAPLRKRMGRKAITRATAERQAELERLMRFGTVLPALPGTTVRSEDGKAMLQANRSEIEKLASQLHGRVQFQLQVGYDRDRAKDWIGPGPGEVDMRMRQRLEQRTSGALAGLACDTLELPVTDGMALNRVLLVEASDEPALDRAIEEIDALWSDGLSIRQIGPSPAVSFCSIGLVPVRKRDLAAACALLGIPNSASAETIANARRSALASHPAMSDAIRTAAQNAAIAAKTGLPAFHRLVTWSEGQRAPETAERFVA